MSRGIQQSRIVALVSATLFAVACSEPYRPTMVEQPVPLVAAGLVLSDAAPPVGGSFTVTTQATVRPGEAVASYTATIRYDRTALHYEGEVEIEASGTRANNSTPGVLRIAGASPHGFSGGLLASFRFTAMKPDSPSTLVLSVEEIHMVTLLDARAQLSLSPVRAIAR